MILNCFSQRGTGKPHNEDAVLLNTKVCQGSIREFGEVDASELCYFAVADGVSSGNLPRMASRRLLEILQSHLAVASATTSLSKLLHQVQKTYAALETNAEFRGMASTLVGVRLAGRTATIFNVGDSRAYLLTACIDGSQARLLSRDHNVLTDMLADGEITPDQASNAASFLRSLTSQFMVDAEFDGLNVHTTTHVLHPGERLLLCSDGLNEVLSDARIAELFVSNSADDLLNACKAARRAGGTDDFSVIVLALQN